MRYINLSLKKHDKPDSDNNIYTLEQIIQNNDIAIVLGSPGSGKTSILEKYFNEHRNESQYVKIKKFLKFDSLVKDEIKVLLLDGLDEYRSVMNDKSFVLNELGNKINELKDIKIIISCREMDWYGETDKNALKEEINKDVAIFRILPLRRSQKEELARLLSVENPQIFIDRFSTYCFLENPQMFTMLADIHKENPNDVIRTKMDLYFTFVKNVREQNIDYRINRINELDSDEILKYGGYIAFFYMFSETDKLNEEFVDEICDQEHGYSRDAIEKTLRTTLFQEESFIHRTIAEFLLANFIVQYKLDNNQIAIERVKNLFIKNGKIPTELRGTYAWLCSLTKSKELIKVDPFYQIVHGDNSLFDNELKKKIVLEVKEYSKSNPYFFEIRQSIEFEGFYNEDLDSFFISEFNEALKKKNHYIFLIINLIITSPKLSSKMKKFLKEKILDEKISEYIKNYILIPFLSDTNFLKDILDRIKDGKILDKKDIIKDALLEKLYPDHINYNKITKYLMIYKEYIIGHCNYLYKTKYKDKYALIDNIYKQSYNKSNSYLVFPENLESFIADYFAETLLKYENGLNAKEIYSIIKYFNKFQNKYERLTFRSYRYIITDELKKKDIQLTKLTNELFSLYIDDMLKGENDDFRIINFDLFFSYKNPTKLVDILFTKMNPSNSPENNRNLFLRALGGLKKEKINFNRINSIAKKFGFEKELSQWENPKKQKWEIIGEKREKKRKEKNNRILKENEKYFSDKSDEQIQSNFGDLNFIAELLYIDNKENEVTHLKDSTFKRLKNILKNAIYNKLIDPELLTIESLAINSPDARRNIDIVYYVSCALNVDVFRKVKNENLLKYLYINALMNRSGNVLKNSLVEQIEIKRRTFVEKTLKEYINLLLETHFPKQFKLLQFYINKEEEFENLKYIIEFFISDKKKIKDNILSNFLNIYNFRIQIKDLKKLFKILTTEKNKNIIIALETLAEGNKDSFSINMAISLYSLFEHKIERFESIESNIKVKLVDYMITQFNTEDSMKSVSGFVSPKVSCAFFLTNKALNFLKPNELKQLLNFHHDEEDLWKYRIAHKVSEFNQQEADQKFKLYSINKIKDFIISNVIISEEDFFEDIYLKIEKLKNVIEKNRDNDKDSFYNESGVSKKEESCRDVIMRRLKDNFGYDIELTKEKHEADNRVDINIKYKANSQFEIQVECKKNQHRDIYKGISDQLINKYMSSKVKYGIYLVFYFGDKDKEILKKNLIKKIPENYKNRIKVILIDLTYKNQF